MQNEQATSTVVVNGEQAKNEMSVLATRAKSLRDAIIEANKAGDGEAFDKLSKQLKATQKEMKQLEKASFDVKKVLDNLSGASPKDLEKALKSLNKELRGGEISRNSKEWIENVEAQKKVRAEIRAINAEMQVGESGISRFTNGFNKYFAAITAGLAAITGLTLGLKKFMDMRVELDESQKNLQSLTGLADADIKWLTDYARELSTTTTDAGAKITASSKEIVDGFTVIGSKRPELLKNKEAMAEVTKQALTLATAGKMETATAFDVVTASMNQFNLEADQSARIINVIAAGSLEGSAEANNLSGSLKNVGTVAKSSNLSLEQTVAALEVLASKQLLGEEAGTKLRGALLKMKEAGVGYVSGAFNMRDAILEINAALSRKTSAAQKDALMVKVFGAENVTAGQILLDNVSAYDKLTKSVTGTSVATNQAKKQSESIAVTMAQARNRFSEAGMALVEKLNPAMLTATNLTTLFLKGIISIPTFLKEYSYTLTALAVAWGAYTVAINAATIASKVSVFWTDKVTTSFKSMATAIKSNPWALIVTGSILAITWLNSYLNKQKEVNVEQSRFNDLALKSKKIFEDSKSLEDRTKIMGSLSREQLENLKSDLQSQINEISKFDAEVMTRSRKAIDTDKQLLKYRSDLGKAKTAIEKAWLQQQIENREMEVVKSISQEYSRNEKQMAVLKKNMAAVDKLLSKKPVVTGVVGDGSSLDNKTKTPKNKKDDPFDKDLKKLDDTFKDEQLLYKQMYAEGFSDQDDYEADMLRGQMNYYKDKIALEQKYGKDSTETQIQLADLIISENDKALKKIEDQDKKAAEAKKKSEEEKLKEQQDFEEKRKQILDKYGLNDIQSIRKTYNAEVKELKDSLKKKLISQQEYEDAVKKVKLKTAQSYVGQVAETAQQAETFLTAVIDAETQAVDNKYAKQIAAAKKAGKDTTKLEEKVEQEKKDIKKKYADVEFAITVARIVSETALAIMKAAPNVPLQIFTGLTGAAQLGVAYQQRAAVKNLWTGGYTDPGDKYEPRGIVHAGEFVANQDAVGNGSLRRVFNLIDYAQKTNTVARITPQDIANSLAIRGGYAGGGYTSQSQSTYSPTTIVHNPDNSRLVVAIERLNGHLDKGITSKTYLSGDNGILDAQQMYDKIKSNATKS